MSDIAIRVEGLGKAYRIAHQAQSARRYRTLREDLVALARAPFSRRDGTARRETIWALKDVSFEVKRGEVLGIIGRNGAGKSTLLKLLARITRPTEGHADVFGRVGSLLEVGTGFHSELTGRENVFLSGAVLGMTRAEVRRKFDEIVDFAEVEKFLDTPVKRYSSGMYMRLAFAVAAHLEPEILLVDEVLAVGDAQFQKKCLGKMGDVAREGRTVLFVSHNIGAVKTLCTHVIYLHSGQIRNQGAATQICNEYLREVTSSSRLSDGKTVFEIEILDQQGAKLEEWKLNEIITIRVKVHPPLSLESPAVDLALYSPEGVKVFALQSDKFASGRINNLGKPFSLAFRLTNPGLSVTALYLDAGIRASYSQEYMSLFCQAQVIPVSAAEFGPYVRTDTIVCLPAEVEYLD